MSDTHSAVVSTCMDARANAYVYAILVDGVVRYIGKGTGRRMHLHVPYARNINRLRANGERVKATLFYNKLAASIRRGLAIYPRVLAEGLTEPEAYDVERREVESRKSELWNTFSGGIGCTTEDAKRRSILAVNRERQIAGIRSPQARAKMSSGMKERWSDPEYRAKVTASIRQQWSDPQKKAKRSKINKDFLAKPEIRAKLSESQKEYNALPGVRELRSKIALTRAADKSFQDKHRAAMVAACATPEAKAKKSAASKRLWLDPDRRAKQEHRLRTMWTPERRAQVSEKLKAFHTAQRQGIAS